MAVHLANLIRAEGCFLPSKGSSGDSTSGSLSFQDKDEFTSVQRSLIKSQRLTGHPLP